MSFLGRCEELELLSKQLSKDGSKTLLYGKRRVGKTTLILEAARDFDGKVIYYECLKSSMQDNIKRLTEMVQKADKNDYLAFADLIELFTYLGNRNERYLLIIDEYQYLKNLEQQGVVDSIFQRIMDSLGANVHIVLSGSYISIMKELLQEDNPLFGRFDLLLNLQNMDYYDSALFYPEASVEDKVSIYAVFGGSPYAGANYNRELTLRDNIVELILKQTGILRSFMEAVLLAELNKTSNANQILLALSNGRKRYTELEEMCAFNQNGLLDKNLKVLINMEIIEKSFPINYPKDKKKIFYSIRDNLVRFYYTFVVGKEHYIQVMGPEPFYDQFIEPYLWQFISFRFEDTAREYFIRQIQSGKMPGIIDVGRYWYNDPVNKKAGEFDVVLKNIEERYSFFEVKCFKEPMKAKLCKEYEEKFKIAAENMKCEIYQTGFVSLGGFENKNTEGIYVTGRDLYKI